MKKALLLCLIPCAFAIVVLTDHYTNAKLGTNDSESRLTSATFSKNFGKTCTLSLDGDVYSQPLYVSNVSGVTGQSGAVNLIIGSTQNGSVYAFNADTCDSPLWTKNFGTVQAANSYPGAVGDLIYNRKNGCKGTPVVDLPNTVIYVVCSTATTWVLHRISLLTGLDIPQPPSAGDSSVVITGTVNSVTFCPLCQQNSAGLTLANGNVYVSFGSMNDATNHGNWYGWIFAYATADLSQVAAFCTACFNASGGGGVWQSGGGLSVDGSGNIYAITGNGSGTPAVGNLSLSVIKLSSTLSVIDWYAPSDYATLNSNDWDLSTGRPMLIPGTALLVFGAKDFNVYSLNTACMGNVGGTANGCTAPQKFVTGSGPPTTHQGIYSCLYVPGLSKGYFPNTAGSVYAFSLSGSTWNTTPTVSSATYEFPGAQMTGSCNGSTNCIIWATAATTTGAQFSAVPGKLVALNPATLAEYWSSATRASDSLGTLTKLTAPTVANGKVYVGTIGGSIVVYGESPSRIVLSN